ncbi:MAG: hypothetical protein UX22_C0001G0002 [Candidatus Jorgensenbacteria bacterium GW2011_GWA2_45_9]|uniref:Uncharacterized protein n=1 Tax=Candidatus Jorgensenbacteria bacterium GW2011_GWA2_45_9 TaxID=1618663 RepID=A0A0G1R4R0_9BACT|nr:MAG: hypothetical protein UX22_C0001G0002 [Candidatus Jorgensenbacteria bacterium GW2011_GWA2_45_9]
MPREVDKFCGLFILRKMARVKDGDTLSLIVSAKTMASRVYLRGIGQRTASADFLLLESVRQKYRRKLIRFATK